MTKKEVNVKRLTIIGVLGAISIVLGMTPLGFIPVGPTRATIMHIPVLIGAIMEGPVVGALVGLIFGISSIFQAITAPTPVSFVFLNPIVSILPRVLIGITTYYTYNFFRKLGNKKSIALLYLIFTAIISYLLYGIYKNIISSGDIWITAMNMVLILLSSFILYFINLSLREKALDIIISSIAGTLTNTLGVLSMIYFLYAERFVKAIGGDVNASRKIIVGIGITNGLPETIIAIIIVTAVVSKLKNKESQ